MPTSVDVIREHTARQAARYEAEVEADMRPGDRIFAAIAAAGDEEYALDRDMAALLDQAATHDPDGVEQAAARAIALTASDPDNAPLRSTLRWELDDLARWAIVGTGVVTHTQAAGLLLSAALPYLRVRP
jgi:hypothetical protein